jgi:hypothetical protein
VGTGEKQLLFIVSFFYALFFDQLETLNTFLYVCFVNKIMKIEVREEKELVE